MNELELPPGYTISNEIKVTSVFVIIMPNGRSLYPIMHYSEYEAIKFACEHHEYKKQIAKGEQGEL